MVNRLILAGLAASFVLILSAPPVHSSSLSGLGLQKNIFQSENGFGGVLQSKISEKTPLTEEARLVKKRQGVAFMKSLLLPGWGQLSEGRKIKGYIFLAAETSLIGSMISFITYKGWLEDDYKAYAAQYAGVSGNRDHVYYVNVGNWMTVDDYNQQRLRFREFDDMYTAPEDAWSWNSESNRVYFRNLRVDADRAGQLAMLMVGGLLINHLLSAIDASQSVEDSAVNAQLSVSGHPSGRIGLDLRITGLKL